MDVLKELCGVTDYDLDFQEVIIDDDEWKTQRIKSLLSQLSYSESFLAEALSVANEKGVTKALYVLAQYRLVYDPQKVKKNIAPDPIFLGCFTFSDEEHLKRIEAIYGPPDE